jgi:signal transduction histidine kinase
MKRPTFDRFESRQAMNCVAIAYCTGAVLLATVALLDWVTGPRLDFSLFYLVPICYVTWKAGPAAGYATAAVGAAVWFEVAELTGSLAWFGPIIPWNALMRLVFFCGTVFLLAGWKRSSKHLALLVERRTRTLRRVTAELLASQEAERRRLASDMHDAFSQTLSLIKMNLDTIQLSTGLPTDAGQRIADCASMVESVTRQARTLMFDLYPAMLDDLGLVPTLQWYGRQLQERGDVDVAVTERGARQPLHPDARNYVFRSAKELLSNAVRHGRPGEVNVAVHSESNRLRLVVDDDGCGFEPDAASAFPHAGLGLSSIRDRLTSLDGRLDIESSPGEGTRVILELPLITPAVTRSRLNHAIASIAG